MVDACLRQEKPDTALVSLDLAAGWSRPAVRPDATLLTARSNTRGQLSTVQATLTGRDGVVRASGTSRCRVYRPRC